MEIVFVIIALAFGTGAVFGALFTYFTIQCCRPSKATAVSVNQDDSPPPEQNHDSGSTKMDEDFYRYVAKKSESGSANIGQDFYRYLADDYQENWIIIVSDDRGVYHTKTDCRTTKRSNPSLFRRYRMCKICGYAMHCDATSNCPRPPNYAATKLD